RDHQSWQGTASELQAGLDGAIDSAETLGRWLRKPENLRRLRVVGFTVEQHKAKTRDRSRLIHIERGQLDESDGTLAANPSPTTEAQITTHHAERKTRRNRRHTGRHNRPHTGRRKSRHMGRHKIRPNRPTVRKRNNRRKSRHA